MRKILGGTLCSAAALAALGSAALAQSPATGDAAGGEKLYQTKCGGCHSLDMNRVGPAHRGVVGRKAGSAPNYAYSPALKAADIAWDEKTLDLWLQNPMAMVKGTRMGFRLSNAQQRAEIIAYLTAMSAKAAGGS